MGEIQKTRNNGFKGFFLELFSRSAVGMRNWTDEEEVQASVSASLLGVWMVGMEGDVQDLEIMEECG